MLSSVALKIRRFLKHTLRSRRPYLWSPLTVGEGDLKHSNELNIRTGLLAAIVVLLMLFGTLCAIIGSYDVLIDRLQGLPTMNNIYKRTIGNPNMHKYRAVAEQLQKGGGFNIKASDGIPLIREVKDFRDEQCKALSYDLSSLPKASVVIVFHNEPFSTLMRTVESVLHRSPPELLEEILLVDDGSEASHIREGGDNRVENYVTELAGVHLMRLPRRLGVVGARLQGIRGATAPIVVTLDSHVEVQEGWLEPLCQRLVESPTSFVLPVVDHIDPINFEVGKGGIGSHLGFSWKLIELGDLKWEKKAMENAVDSTSVGKIVKTPIMGGGAFAVMKKFFFDIGGYDEGFQCWGSENIELSFRVWMCGGFLESLPCSRIFHAFRLGGWSYQCGGDSNIINKLRTLIWMDDTADLAWKVLGAPDVPYDKQSLKQRIKLRQDLKCNNFDWYLKNVFPEGGVTSMKDVPYLGKITNKATNMCLKWTVTPDVSDVILKECHDSEEYSFMYFNKTKNIHPTIDDEVCLGNDNRLVQCNYSKRFQWIYDTQQRLSNEGLCLAAEKNTLLLSQCTNDTSQKWIFTENSSVKSPPYLKYNTKPPIKKFRENDTNYQKIKREYKFLS